MTRAAVIACVLVASAPAARADDVASMTASNDDDVPVDDLEPLRPKLSEQVADAVTELGGEIDAHLGALSAGTLSLRLDGRARRVHVGFDVEGESMGLRFRSDVVMRGGVARVQTRIDLSVIGRDLHLELPDLEVVPRSFAGERYVEVRLPLLSGSF